ncbi:hypothetical protein EVAR_10511_1 [Eumeta japonica]|uniref:Uncharacterized protein n=1 Tax=Eumeta variegata TaxID=151549 RepID=A0A4C1TK27_EUMVA|nr:hypothetical protein EVAR_10511_1 [Eumeta japonica]
MISMGEDIYPLKKYSVVFRPHRGGTKNVHELLREEKFCLSPCSLCSCIFTLGLELSASKSNLVVFSRKRTVPDVPVILEGVKIPCKKSIKFLGQALRIIVDCMKSSPTNALQVECADPPFRLRRQFLSDRFLSKLLRSKDDPSADLHFCSMIENGWLGWYFIFTDASKLFEAEWV